MANTETGGLANAIEQALSEYSEELAENVDKIIDDVSEEAKGKLEENSPIKTGKYKKSWKIKVVTNKKGNKQIVVYNKISSLTHLLENGHVIKNTGERTQAFPHIKPIEEWANSELQRRIEEATRK